jgi:hypothetical protein
MLNPGVTNSKNVLIFLSVVTTNAKNGVTSTKPAAAAAAPTTGKSYNQPDLVSML